MPRTGNKFGIIFCSLYENRAHDLCNLQHLPNPFLCCCEVDQHGVILRPALSALGSFPVARGSGSANSLKDDSRNALASWKKKTGRDCHY
jgi:hypothetical protein